MTPLVVPSVPLNAASQEALVRQGFAIMSALDSAICAYRQALPHGHHYLCLVEANTGHRTVDDASKAWFERIEKLSTLHREMAFWIRSVDRQGREFAGISTPTWEKIGENAGQIELA